MKRVNVILLSGIFLFALVASVFVVSAGNVLHISAEIQSNDSYLYLNVVNPDISLGNVEKGEKSSEITVEVTNNGTEDITIYPSLPFGYNGKVFEYLTFREQKTDSVNGVKNISRFIGNWS